MKLTSLFLALIMALLPLLGCAEETAAPTAEELFMQAYAAATADPPDYAKAEEYYLAAAELGHAGAMLNLGLAYANGDFTGGTPDFDKAKAMLMMAAALEQSEAIYALGYYYATGAINNGVPDYAEMEKWYLKAGEMGNINALINLGIHYYNGQNADGKPDYVKSRTTLQKAAELGNGEAMYHLGLHYEDGTFNQDWLLEENVPDPAKALTWYEAGWEAGSMNAGERLIVLYAIDKLDEDGNILIAADHAKLLQLVEKLCASGTKNVNAYSWLGWFYAGNSDLNLCETDYQKAFEAYKRGAALGYGYCMWQIGRMYEDGRLGMVDLIAAEAWITKAIAAGESSPVAQEDLERIRSLLEAQ